MILVDKSITIPELVEMSHKLGGLVKAVVDIEQEIMVIDADLHADQEKMLLQQGSNQDNVWGINLYPSIEGDDFIEFDSMINVRPRLNNMTRGVEKQELQNKIRSIVSKLVQK